MNNTKGAALVEYVVLLALLGIITLSSVTILGERVRCIFEDSAIALGYEGPSTCSTLADNPLGPVSSTPVGSTPPSPPPPVAPYGAPSVVFDTTPLDSSNYTNTSLTVSDLDPGDSVTLVITQGATTLTVTDTTLAPVYQFTNIDLSSFSRGTITAEVTRTDGFDTATSAPATANLNLPLTIVPDTPLNGSGFGLEIAMTSNRIFVGAPFENSVGRVYAFDRATGAQLFTIDPIANVNQFGSIMAEGDGFLAITSQETSAGNDFVTVYDMNGNELFTVDEDPGTPNENYFGREIQIENSVLYVGDQLHVFGVGNQGGVHAFDLTNGGALLWSAQNNVFAGSGSRFDVYGNRIIATNWSQNGITIWDTADGSVVEWRNLANAQRQHIEYANGFMVFGDNPFDIDIYDMDPFFFQGSMSLPLYAHSPINIYEQAGDNVLMNTGSDHNVHLVDLSTQTVLGTIDFPDALPPLVPQFGAGMAYDGGEVAIGAPGHQPLYDGNRSGAVYLLPLP